MDVIRFGARWLCVLVLLAAFLAKIVDPGSWQVLIPLWVVLLLEAFLLVAVLLWPQQAAVPMMLVFMGFAGFQAARWWWGLGGSCACFAAFTPSALVMLALDLLLVACAALLLSAAAWRRFRGLAVAVVLVLVFSLGLWLGPRLVPEVVGVDAQVAHFQQWVASQRELSALESLDLLVYSQNCKRCERISPTMLLLHRRAGVPLLRVAVQELPEPLRGAGVPVLVHLVYGRVLAVQDWSRVVVPLSSS